MPRPSDSAGPASPRSPVTPSVAGELRRVQERWRVLPLDRAAAHAAQVRRCVQLLADRVAEQRGEPPCAVPELGPATLMDQLAVLVYDASEAGIDDGSAAELAALRQSLS